VVPLERDQAFEGVRLIGLAAVDERHELESVSRDSKIYIKPKYFNDKRESCSSSNFTAATEWAAWLAFRFGLRMDWR
jgi:hypothetical protein